MKLKLAGIAAIAALSGCATTPFSYIDGNRYFKTDMHSYSVIVLDVDGRSDTRNPVMVDPGRHVIRVQGPAASGFRYGETREITLDVKPCTRYYLKAVKKNQLEQNFEPQVDYVEPIAGCKSS
ncbi:MAG TPA: hypothetical protein VNA44_03200 [Burkholderiaceae bacterium]|nr:hypothetical protein [Burkholderiaceae bacterium]